MGSGAILDGQGETIPGLTVTNWLDDPALRLKKGEDFRTRSTSWIRQIVLHTTKGIPGGSDGRPQIVKAGLGPSTNAGERAAHWWTKDPTSAGAHLVVDFDGAVYCCVDLIRESAQHAGIANNTSVGIEIAQGGDAELYAGQLEAVVLLVDWLTARLGIQRQIPHRYLGPVQRFANAESLAEVVGVIGHRDLTGRRGPGDPGSAIFNRLGIVEYEPVNFDLMEDKELWRRRQRELGIQADGIAGPATVTALKTTGRRSGLWVGRPVDLSFES